MANEKTNYGFWMIAVLALAPISLGMTLLAAYRDFPFDHFLWWLIFCMLFQLAAAVSISHFVRVRTTELYSGGVSQRRLFSRRHIAILYSDVRRIDVIRESIFQDENEMRIRSVDKKIIIPLALYRDPVGVLEFLEDSCELENRDEFEDAMEKLRL